MKLLLCALIVAVMNFAAPANAADETTLAIGFTFHPAFRAVAHGATGIWVDVCGDAACTEIVSSIPLACQRKKTADPDFEMVSVCQVSVSGQPGDPDGDLALLDHPVDLQLRGGSAQPVNFHFDGSMGGVTAKGHRFDVRKVGDGLVVRAGR